MHMNQLQIFSHPQFGEVEIIEIDGKQWFGATKTAIALKYVNPHDAISRHCRSDGVVKHEVIDSLGRTQEMNFINEGNLYRLITKSKLPDAEKFETWVFDDLIPTVRKTGTYSITPQFKLPQTKIEAMEAYLEEMKKTALLEAENQFLALESAEQKQKLKEQEAPVAIYNLAISAGNAQSMSVVAKALGTGRNRLFDDLRDHNIIMKNSRIPYQKFIDAGYFIVRESPRQQGDAIVNEPVTKVTAKGFEYIAKLLKTS